MELQRQAGDIDAELGETYSDGQPVYPPTVEVVNSADNPEFVARVEEIERIMAELDEYFAQSYTEKHHLVKSARTRLSAKVQEFQEFSSRTELVIDIGQKPNPEYTRRRDELERLNEKHCRIVELRYLAGLSVGETAAALGIAASTVKLNWRIARAWLLCELHEED